MNTVVRIFFLVWPKVIGLVVGGFKMFGRKQQTTILETDRMLGELSIQLGKMRTEIGALHLKLDAIRETVGQESGRVDRLADRLVQMAMVNRGNAREALGIGRAQNAPLQKDDELNDWGERPDTDDEWVSYPG